MEIKRIFDEGLSAIDKEKQSPREKIRALRKLSKMARTFNEWLCLYYSSKNGSVLERDALKRLATLPASREQLLETLEFAPLRSKLRKSVTNRLATRGISDLDGHEKPFSVGATLLLLTRQQKVNAV